MPQTSLDYQIELRRQKYVRRKKRLSGRQKKHLARLNQHPNAVATRFKPGLTGEKSPRWKGGYYFRKYGITYEQYDDMLARQGGVCALCSRPPKKQRLVVDHDHKTGKVRGLLCFRCNYGLSWYQDDPTRFHRAYMYLRGELQFL